MSFVARFRNRVRGRVCGASGGWIARAFRDLSGYRDIRAFPPLAVWAGVHCVSLMLLIRRSADAGALKLTPSQISVTATIAAILMIAGRAMLARIERRPPATWLRLVAACASVVPIVDLFFGSNRRLPLGTTAYLGAIALVVGSAMWLWNREFIDRLLASFLLSPTHAPGIVARPMVAVRAPVAADTRAERDELEILRLKRITKPDGSDRLEGAMLADFACGQSIATLHIPFLPTFSRAPQFVCQIDNESAVRIKGAVVYPYGCRVELKRSTDHSAATRVEIRFSATLESLSRAA